MTTDTQLNQLRYPIGPFSIREQISDVELQELISTIASAPAKYRALTQDLAESDLKKTYRPGSWNVQQLVNHVADISLLHLFRMKKALTEDYKEATLISMDGWADTADGRSSPIADSLDMFEAITKRQVHLIRSLDARQLSIAYYHPVRKISIDQKNAIGMSAWHVKHHLEHVRIAVGS